MLRSEIILTGFGFNKTVKGKKLLLHRPRYRWGLRHCSNVAKKKVTCNLSANDWQSILES